MSFPTFSEFYEACHGRSPLPWQRRLAERVVTTGWPDEIGVPTGLGKTTCLDIAVWSLAAQANRAPAERTAPTRIWYVVNRRLLVDSAFDEVLTLQQKLRASLSGEDSVIRTVAQVLQDMAAMGSETFGPLHVTHMRGGIGRFSMVPDPSQPAVMLSTVPMFASRWLFRGYGASTSRRPIDAALAGIDSLVLLDEAHLSSALAASVGPVSQCDAGNPGLVMNEQRARVQFASMTATGDALAEDRFDLDAEDRAHPLVKQRLQASKRVTLAPAVPAKQLPRQLARSTSQLLEGSLHPGTCVVFVNSPATARDVKAELDKQFSHVVLLTGEMREREAENVRRFLLDPERGLRSGSPRQDRQEPLIVVATQTLEVGADLDFDFLATETASVRALTQRFGRLNRLGSLADARAVICHAVELKKPSKLYGDEPVEVWDRLQRLGEGGKEISFAPADIANVLGPPGNDDKRVPELLPSHVWEWAKTSVSPLGEAPPRLFFEGFTEDLARVSVAWRVNLPDVGGMLMPSLASNETVDVPLYSLRTFLEDLTIDDVARLSADGATLEVVVREQLRPGDQVVLPCSAGGYDSFGWNPGSHKAVLDICSLVSNSLSIDEATLENLVPEPEEDLRSAWSGLRAGIFPDDAGRTEKTCIAEVVSLLGSSQHHPDVDTQEWQAFLESLTKVVDRPIGAVPSLRRKLETDQFVVVSVAADAFDGLSFLPESQDLRQHMGSVGDLAGRTARKLGCSDALVATCRLAGQWHDVGKSDPRFQRWLDPEPDPQRNDALLLAKSAYARALSETYRVQAGWPKGGRHELISGQVLTAALASGWRPDALVDIDLLLHLVLSHHGHARPTVATVADPFPVRFVVGIDDIDVKLSADLSLQDWDQPARFRRLCERYGYWGLALLETVVRLADHAASSQVGHDSVCMEVM